MEKKRRARINASLVELKSLLLDAAKKEAPPNNKMEKADILEMAVRHLKQIQKQQMEETVYSDATKANRYILGFNACVQEISKYLGSDKKEDLELKTKILGHLTKCVNNNNQSCSASSFELVNQNQSQIISSSQKLPENFQLKQTENEETDSKSEICQFNTNLNNPTNSTVSPTLSTEQKNDIPEGLAGQTLPHASPLHIPVVNFNPMSFPTQTLLQIPQNENLIYLPQYKQQLPIPVIRPATQENFFRNLNSLKPQTVMQTEKQLNNPGFHGLQIIPSTDITFIIPGNVSNSNQLSNYVIPIVHTENPQKRATYFADSNILSTNMPTNSQTVRNSSPDVFLSNSQISSEPHVDGEMMEDTKTTIGQTNNPNQSVLNNKSLAFEQTENHTQKRSKTTQYFSVNQSFSLTDSKTENFQPPRSLPNAEESSDNKLDERTQQTQNSLSFGKSVQTIPLNLSKNPNSGNSEEQDKPFHEYPKHLYMDSKSTFGPKNSSSFTIENKMVDDSNHPSNQLTPSSNNVHSVFKQESQYKSSFFRPW